VTQPAEIVIDRREGERERGRERGRCPIELESQQIYVLNLPIFFPPTAAPFSMRIDGNSKCMENEGTTRATVLLS